MQRFLDHNFQIRSGITAVRQGHLDSTGPASRPHCRRRAANVFAA